MTQLQNGQLENLMVDARKRLQGTGTEKATDADRILGGLQWLDGRAAERHKELDDKLLQCMQTHQLTGSASNGNGRKGTVAIPVATGGIVAVILALERIAEMVLK